MREIVFPDNNEQEFIDLALKLGIKELVFVYSKKAEFYKQKSDIKITNALLVEPKHIQKAKSEGILAVCISSREAIECSADIIFGAETQESKDKTHYRLSGLNHILCKIAAEKKVTVGFSVSSILEALPKQRAIILGRMMQNIRMCAKYKVPVLIASFSKNTWHLRQSPELSSLFSQLGISAGKIKSAL